MEPTRKRGWNKVTLGARFGSLVVIGFVPRQTRADGKPATSRRVVVQCDCGRVSTPYQSNVGIGRTRSCGCTVRKPRDIRSRTLIAMEANARREVISNPL